MKVIIVPRGGVGRRHVFKGLSAASLRLSQSFLNRAWGSRRVVRSGLRAPPARQRSFGAALPASRSMGCFGVASERLPLERRRSE